jgi:hypothetical protein
MFLPTDGVWLQRSLSMGVIRKVVKGLEFAAGLAGRAGGDGGRFDPERVRMGAV